LAAAQIASLLGPAESPDTADKRPDARDLQAVVEDKEARINDLACAVEAEQARALARESMCKEVLKCLAEVKDENVVLRRQLDVALEVPSPTPLVS
jgi:hypothetical protein